MDRVTRRKRKIKTTGAAIPIRMSISTRWCTGRTRAPSFLDKSWCDSAIYFYIYFQYFAVWFFKTFSKHRSVDIYCVLELSHSFLRTVDNLSILNLYGLSYFWSLTILKLPMLFRDTVSNGRTLTGRKSDFITITLAASIDWLIDWFTSNGM